MPEAGLARDLIRQAEDLAIARGARRVTAVTVRIGSLVDVTGDQLRKRFAEESRGTMAEGATIGVVEGPGGEGAASDPHSMDLLLTACELEEGV